MTYSEQKIVDEINRLYEAGYDCNFPPLAELLDVYDRITAREERQARLSEQIGDWYE